LLQLYLRSLLIGLAIAAPVGPIGVLCIRRTLAFGRLSGFVSGLGAATADALYGSVAAFGLTFISQLLIGQRFWLGLLGGCFLCYLGLRTLLEKPSAAAVLQAEEAGMELTASGNPALGAGTRSSRSLRSDYVTTLLLTLTNPMTILSFVAIFAGLGLGGYTAPGSALMVVAGVFSGSAAWWLLLSSAANALRVRFLKPGGLVWVNRISGVIILGFGLLALGSAIF
jgi:threonine/homoserine/homoserine lactone efflux protein